MGLRRHFHELLHLPFHGGTRAIKARKCCLPLRNRGVGVQVFKLIVACSPNVGKHVDYASEKTLIAWRSLCSCTYTYHVVNLWTRKNASRASKSQSGRRNPRHKLHWWGKTIRSRSGVVRRNSNHSSHPTADDGFLLNGVLLATHAHLLPAPGFFLRHFWCLLLSPHRRGEDSRGGRGNEIVRISYFPLPVYTNLQRQCEIPTYLTSIFSWKSLFRLPLMLPREGVRVLNDPSKTICSPSCEEVCCAALILCFFPRDQWSWRHLLSTQSKWFNASAASSRTASVTTKASSWKSGHACAHFTF